MDMDFSHLNLQYLIQARDLAREDLAVAAALLGAQRDLAALLAQATAVDLAHITEVKPPLIVPRAAPWWWARLFTALREGQPGEIEAVLAHAGLIMAP